MESVHPLMGATMPQKDTDIHAIYNTPLFALGLNESEFDSVEAKISILTS